MASPTVVATVYPQLVTWKDPGGVSNLIFLCISLTNHRWRKGAWPPTF